MMVALGSQIRATGEPVSKRHSITVETGGTKA